jgi:hypothetical protein
VSGRGVSCGIDCSEEVGVGTTVTLTASADELSSFVGWKGVECAQGSQTDVVCTFTVDADARLVAVFEAVDLFGPGGVE